MSVPTMVDILLLSQYLSYLLKKKKKKTLKFYIPIPKLELSNAGQPLSNVYDRKQNTLTYSAKCASVLLSIVCVLIFSD